MLASPAESVTVDFKAVLGWSTSKGAQVECLRDLVCLANRRGGRIIVGVRQTGGSTFALDGLRPGDDIPDPTKVGQLFRNYFDPVVAVETAQIDVGGKTFGVLEVPGATGYPLICSQTYQDDPQKPPLVRRGAIYVRTDGANCEEAGPQQLREVIDIAVSRTGAAIRRMLTTTETTSASQRAVATSLEDVAAAKKYTTLRAADLRAVSPLPRLTLRRLEQLLETSRVIGGGSTYFPRRISRIDDGLVTKAFRLPDRLIMESEGKGLEGTESLSVARFGRSGDVAVRESLWEDAIPQVGPNKIGTTALFGFANATLLFAKRFYEALSVTDLKVRVGIIGPLGRSLFSDSNRRSPFFNDYRATSDQDIWVERDLTVASLATFADRLERAKDICDELFEYFGWELSPPVVEALLNDLKGFVALDYDK